MRHRAAVTVILNSSSGISRTGAPESAVREALAAAGVNRVEVLPLRPGLDIAGAAQTTDVLVAAGGDGTVSAVAAALAGTGKAMGVLPAGTLNHFARDLGIPTDLEDAARVIAAGRSRCVDVARVNGRVFVNNSSLGVYPAMVTARDRLIRRGWPKHAATGIGAMAALWQFPNISLRLTAGDSGVVARTPFVFIGNNTYTFSGFDAGTRSGLEDGVLQVCTLRRSGRIAFLSGMARSLIGAAGNHPDMHVDCVTEVRVRTFRRRVRVALDGEVVRMQSPLVYSVWPKALRVLAPAQS